MGLRFPVTLFHPHPLFTLIFLGPVKTQWVALAWVLSQASPARKVSFLRVLPFLLDAA